MYVCVDHYWDNSPNPFTIIPGFGRTVRNLAVLTGCGAAAAPCSWNVPSHELLMSPLLSYFVTKGVVQMMIHVSVC